MSEDKPRPLSFEAEWRAWMEARKQEALEAMAQGFAHPVTVEVALDWDDHERLGELLAALDARPEFLWPPVGADVGQRAIGVTVTVKARTEGGPGDRHPGTRRRMEKLGLLGD